MKTALTVRIIVGIVADYYDIKPAVIFSGRTTLDIVRARHAAIWLADKYTTYTKTMIARHTGERNHTTVCTALKKFPAKLEADPDLACEVFELGQIIEKAALALEARRVKLKPDIDAHAVALRIVASQWNETTVSLEEVRTLAHALLAARKSAETEHPMEGQDDE